jgi:hypothetical protein
VVQPGVDEDEHHQCSDGKDAGGPGGGRGVPMDQPSQPLLLTGRVCGQVRGGAGGRDGVQHREPHRRADLFGGIEYRAGDAGFARGDLKGGEVCGDRRHRPESESNQRQRGQDMARVAAVNAELGQPAHAGRR